MLPVGRETLLCRSPSTSVPQFLSRLTYSRLLLTLQISCCYPSSRPEPLESGSTSPTLAPSFRKRMRSFRVLIAHISSYCSAEELVSPLKGDWSGTRACRYCAHHPFAKATRPRTLVCNHA
uniref:Uncharacterized protein n=1 Tax=Eimeria tenella TaxID=5802 RepID=H9B9I4_EIMTE|nr:hypothetical protein [Eimeria tenella]